MIVLRAASYPAEYTDHCDGDDATSLIDDGLLQVIPGISSSGGLFQASLVGMSRATGGAGGLRCDPILGDSVLGSFELNGRNKWMSLGWSACSVPLFAATFYLGVRFVRHEKR